MNRLAAIGLIVAGIIHLLPALGMLGPERLQALYGVALDDPNLVILLRHRALLFTLLGAFLVAAALRPAWRGLALAAGYASVLGFFGFAWSAPDYNAEVARVVMGDWIALLGLAIATVAGILDRDRGGRRERGAR